MNQNWNNTDQRIKEISESVEFFIKKNKLKLIIWWWILFIILLVMIFWWWTKYDKEKLKSKMTELSFETNKVDNINLLEWTVKVVKEWVTWLVKDYYEVVDWEEITRLRERKCDWCREIENQEEEIGRYPLEQALIDSRQTVQNSLQFIKNKDFLWFENLLADDWVNNMKEREYKKLLKDIWFELNSFILWECSWNFKQTDYMEILCKIDVSYKFFNTNQINEKIDLRVVFNRWTKRWWIVFPFPYKRIEHHRLSSSWKIDASVNTSLSILQWTIHNQLQYLHWNNLLFWTFRTNQLFDYIVVEDFISYKKKSKNKDWNEIEENIIEKLWTYKVNLRKWWIDEFVKFNDSFFFKKDQRWIYEIDAYIPISKPKWIWWKEWKFENWEAFIWQIIHLTPWINTVNPYLKFPTIQFTLDDKKQVYDFNYNLAWE